MPSATTPDLDIVLPDIEGADQDEEWCEVSVNDGRRRRIRFHDYHEIYEIPGLYERIFYDELRCESPQVVRELLEQALEDRGADPEGLRVLDLGAGNGMVAEELAELGAGTLVGIDIIEEAAEAAERDRPGLYDDYHVADLTSTPPDVSRALAEADLNCLASVAALGFGDIPPRAFAEACNFIANPGWVAFNIKEDFLEDEDPSGFNLLMQWMLEEGSFQRLTERRYRHRFSVAGDPLHYIAIIAEKRDDIPEEWVQKAEAAGH